ncbi:coronin [Anaeramoeba ignava]|uniref:Coronin n=1 Tax=Anaeramoeba ignava TaxID=1746090 RepID=A0A9Q0L7L0_ANAIG|nr:coronin [Anaeramoeba ignava]|eukprot:Anaeramoba_ignava/a347217_2971.p1 GENE.a347217_2971~~a347217_2971.p1  ORF type:complete len:450 (+),score=159.39 a347217_2971:18-1367(+)
MNIVRRSKYRHVFGTEAKRENCFDGIQATKTAWDGNFVAANTKFVAACWASGGGGAFAVLPLTSVGKLGVIPLVKGHTGKVLDLAFNPFNPNLIGSSSEDCTAKIWNIPDEGLKEDMKESVQNLNGHKRKVGHIVFHPSANNVVSTTSADYTVKIWDIEKGEEKITTTGPSNIIQSFSWNMDGSQFAISAKDKKLRIYDPRADTSPIAETEAHTGVKGFRVVWLTDKDKIFTVGFSRTSDRQFAIWDPREMEKPLSTMNIDTSSGVIMPFYDPDTSVLYLAGKGDGNIRYYEMIDEPPYYYALSEFKSSVPTHGMAMAPKLACDVNSCEIARAYKMANNMIQPIPFVVPRKSDFFQDDIFPPTFGMEPGMTADEWFEGGNNLPEKISLEGGFVQPEIKAEFKPEKQTDTPTLEITDPVLLREKLEKAEKTIKAQEKRIADLEAALKAKN